MGNMESRHTEKASLFNLLKGEYENDFKAPIAYHKAIMEPEDVKLVQKEFDDWKNSKEQK